MHLMTSIIDLFLHLDTHFQSIVSQYGTLTYAIFFVIILCETGLVVTPFLPGDSLLFAAGTFAAKGPLNFVILLGLLSAAAVVGDSINYAVGHAVGPRVFTGNIPFLKREYLDRTRQFFERYGAKAIALGRFVPIVRTCAPFVAGIGAMRYPTFLTYNIGGGLTWVTLFLGAGYFFGNVPFVKAHFSVVILLIIIVSLVPAVMEWVQGRGRGKGTVTVPE